MFRRIYVRFRTAILGVKPVYLPDPGSPTTRMNSHSSLVAILASPRTNESGSSFAILIKQGLRLVLSQSKKLPSIDFMLRQGKGGFSPTPPFFTLYSSPQT